ncbi:cadherin-like beta sandwich domain-containing protein, partial [Tumebacillus flagellatus]
NQHLDVGSNTITVVVTAADHSTKTYTLTVIRAGSSNNDLSNLTVSAGTLDPVFAAKTVSYTVNVGNEVTDVTVTPTVADSTATVTVNSKGVASGDASQPIALHSGENIITVTVTAENGTPKTYTITVNRAPSGNADLSNLQLSSGALKPVFASGTIAYTATVGASVNNLTVTPTTADSNATVTVNGAIVASGQASSEIKLKTGENPITVVVTAQDGTTKTYTVTVTRTPAQNNGGATPGTGNGNGNGKVTVVVTGGGSNPGSSMEDLTKKIGSTLNMSATILGTDGKPLNLPAIPIDSKGTFQLPNVPAGTYSMVLNVVAPNGEKLAGQKATLTIDGSGSATIQIQLIDPFGVVRDSITHQPIDGVKTTLYWADTQLNRDKGRTPNTPVPLPELPDMAPNQNHNPQTTRDGGQYGWMVYPDADYYMISEKDGYLLYDSRQDLRDEAQGDTSYIRNGLIHVGQTIVQMNYDMTQASAASGVHKPYIYGYPDGTFGPDQHLTRAELAAILARLLPDDAGKSATPNFTDLQTSHWAYSSIAKVFGQKIMIGNPDGSFRPDAEVTRAEMAVVIAKLKQLPTALDTNFSDIGSHWARQFIAQAELAGFVTGYPDQTYRPDQAITRAETVVIMNRVLGRHVQHVDAPSLWSDVSPDFWGYAEIMEAAQEHDYQLLQDGTEVWKQN